MKVDKLCNPSLKNTKIIMFLLVLTISISFVSAVNINNTLMAYWSNDNTSISGSTLYDDFASYDGTINGATTGVDGILGEALEFSGDWVVMSNIINQDSFSISLWFKSTQSNKGQFVTQYSDGGGEWIQFYLSEPTTGDIAFAAGGGPSVSGSFNDGSWHHVVGIHSETTYFIYVDGELLANLSRGATPTPYASTRPFRMGAYASSSSSQNYYGLLDEVAVYSGNLSEEQVLALYNEGNACNPIENPDGCINIQINTDMYNNSINFNDANLTINYNVSGATTGNCSLYVNDVLNQTDSDVDLSINQDFTYDFIVNETVGDFNFKISCEIEGVEYNTSNYLYRVDLVAPTIASNYDKYDGLTFNYDYLNETNDIINVTTYYFDDNLFAINETIKCDGIVVFNYFEENITGNNLTRSNLFNTSDFGEGSCEVILQDWDSHTAKKVRTYSIDDYNPVIDETQMAGYQYNSNMMIYTPLDSLKNNQAKHTERDLERDDRYTFGFEYQHQNVQQELYIETTQGHLTPVTEDGYQGHVVNLETVNWADLVSEDITNLELTQLSPTLVKATFINLNKIVLFESIGDLNNNTKTYNFYIEQIPTQPIITQPTGGETWLMNETNTITWTEASYNNNTQSIIYHLGYYNGNAWYPLINISNTTSYEYNIEDISSDFYKFRIKALYSDNTSRETELNTTGFFSVYNIPTQPNITRPSEGEVVTESLVLINWTESVAGLDTPTYNISYSTDNSTWTHITDSSGVFGLINEQSMSITGSGLTYQTTNSLGDLDNNGYTDMLTCNYGTHICSWSENIASGDNIVNWVARTNWTNNIPTLIGDNIDYGQTCDINGDGLLDIVVQGDGLDIITYFLNNGTYESPDWYIADTATGRRGYHIGCGDLNDDGYDDVITFNSVPNSRNVILYSNATGYSGTTIQITGALGDSSKTPLVYDYDGDGDNDITYASLPLFGVRNDGNDVFTYISSPGWITSTTGYGSMIGDYDNDGAIEFVIFKDAYEFQYDMTYDWDASSVDDGNYYLEVSAINSPFAIPSTVNFDLNVYPPTTNITFPDGGEELLGQVIQVYEINWTEAETEQNFTIDILYSNNNGSNWTYLDTISNGTMEYLWNISNMTKYPGGTTYKVGLNSSDGTLSSFEQSFNTFEIVQNTEPNIPSITSPVNGTSLGLSTIPIIYSGTDPDNDTLTYEVYLDSNSTPTNLVQNNNLTTYSFSGSDGTYYVRVRSYDGVEFSDYSDIITFTKDTNVPAITQMTPSDGQTINEGGINFYYTVNTTANYSIDYCDLYIKGMKRDTKYNVTPNTIANLTTSLTPGDDYYWYVTCVDEYGLSGTSSSNNFFVILVDPISGTGGTDPTVNTKEVPVIDTTKDDTVAPIVPVINNDKIQKEIIKARSAFLERINDIFDKLELAWNKVPVLQNVDLKQTLLATTIVVMVWQFVYKPPVKKKKR